MTSMSFLVHQKSEMLTVAHRLLLLLPSSLGSSYLGSPFQGPKRSPKHTMVWHMVYGIWCMVHGIRYMVHEHWDFTKHDFWRPAMYWAF